jgi:hypothetical protein
MSLETVMVEMVQRLEALCRDGGRIAAQPLDEFEAFMTVDPLLAMLHKQLAEARVHYNSLKQKRGASDPMTEIAADQAESAESAMQTRLIELRSDCSKQRDVLRVMRQAKEQAEHRLQQLSAQDILRRMELADDQNDDAALAFALMTLVKRIHGVRPTRSRRLSMAHTFNAMTMRGRSAAIV